MFVLVLKGLFAFAIGLVISIFLSLFIIITLGDKWF